MNSDREAGFEAGCDVELVARLGTDPDALEAFYRQHVGAVAAFVARRVSDAYAVADIVSNTFVAAIRGAASFDRARSPETARFWLLAIARHEVGRYQGQAGRQRLLLLDDDTAIDLTDDETARIDDLIDAERLAPEIRSAVDDLSPRVRDVFVLVVVDGIPQAEAASMLGISHTALRARLARARHRLREHLGALESRSSERSVPDASSPAPPHAAADSSLYRPPPGGADDRSLLPSNVPGGSHGL